MLHLRGNIWLKVLIGLLSLSLAYLLLSFYAGKKLRELLVASLNEQLKVKVEVKSIDLEVFRHFPMVSVRFNELKIHESKEFYGTYLLETPSLSLVFNPLKVYGAQIEVRKIALDKGKIRLHQFDDGSSNFEIVESGNEQTDTRFDLNLKDVRLNKSNFIFTDDAGMSLNVTSGKMVLKVHVDASSYDVTVIGNAFVDHLMNGGNMLVYGKRIDLDGQLKMDADATRFEFGQFHLGIEELKTELDGSIVLEEAGPYFDLGFKADQLDVSQLISLLPAERSGQFGHMLSEGSMNLEGSIKGPLNEGLNPGFLIKFNTNKLRLFSKKTNLDVHSINFSGMAASAPFYGIPDPTWNVALNEARLGDDMLQLSASYTPESLVTNIKAKGSLDLRRVAEFFQEPDSFPYKGSLRFNVSVGIPKEDTLWEQTSLDGDLIAKDVSLPDRMLPVALKDLYADLHFDADVITINKLSGRTDQSDLLFKGVISNYRKTGTDGSTNIQAELFCNKLVLDEWFPETEQSSAKSDSEDALILPSMDIKVSCRQLIYEKITAGSVLGTLSHRDEIWSLNRCAAKVWNGTLLLDAIYRSGSDAGLDVGLDCNNLSIDVLFKDFDNFGQDELTYKHLSGALSGRVFCKLPFLENGGVDLDKLELISHVVVKNGRLKGYEPLYDLSKFVALDELKDIQFDEMENDIEISDRTIIIPKMVLQNSALNLELWGTHSFDNEMNYHFGVEVSELLANKAKWLQKAKGENLERKKDGRVRIFIHLSGTPDNMKLNYDTEVSRRKQQDKIEQQGQPNLRERLKEATKPDSKQEQPAEADWWDE